MGPDRYTCRHQDSLLPENLGIPAGRNAGVGQVEGEYLCFLDDDSWFLDDDFLIAAVQRFKSIHAWVFFSRELLIRSTVIKIQPVGFHV
ncbi:glycosyltransferase [Glutamicibacter sp. M10]|uniref:glycosyltransferase n=1 Tax=Glutamicibacter sp. M10 TaxID=3023076 RepID=UPI0029056021|nr:glycosyltransferase [Glutamicibacter sp. M10]